MARRRRTHPLLSEEAIVLVAERFRSLADPSRLRILNTLMEGETSVGDLAEAVEMEQPTVSRHLSVLRNQGIVARRSDGNRAIYRIIDPTVLKLCELVCSELADRLSLGLEDRGSYWYGCPFASGRRRYQG